MSGSSSVAALLAFVVAVAGFSGVCLPAPVGYPADSVAENGLIREIVFGSSVYTEMEWVQARLVYRNPSDSAVSFTPSYPVTYEQFADGVKVDWGGWGTEEKTTEITIAPGGVYEVCDVSFEGSIGWNEVEWEGVRRGVTVERSGVVMRVVTDKDVYFEGEGGTAILEYYNPTRHNITINPPDYIKTSIIFPNGDEGVRGYILPDWVWGNYPLAPGESRRIYSFHFSTYQVGKLTLIINDVSKTVEVVPRK